MWDKEPSASPRPPREPRASSIACLSSLIPGMPVDALHCISGLGFGKGPYLPAPQEEDEDNLLSPETCYECKINGYPKRGRQRRSVNGTERHQVRNPGHPAGDGARLDLQE
uniref:Uncharacterized protein n=1 Tax=Chloebia gouldiae TaxID=44316 RepID=A0A3L8RT63_CHLGU|nr:hypothetical protein DV515_00016707 [Chloebia gouldiae]